MDRHNGLHKIDRILLWVWTEKLKQRNNMKKLITTLLLACLPLAAFADYDAQITGNISMLETYPSGYIHIALDNQPTSHPSCDARMFVVHDSTAAHLRQKMLSDLMEAQQGNMQVMIGYDSQGDCVKGKIRVYAAKKVTS